MAKRKCCTEKIVVVLMTLSTISLLNLRYLYKGFNFKFDIVKWLEKPKDFILLQEEVFKKRQNHIDSICKRYNITDQVGKMRGSIYDCGR